MKVLITGGAGFIGSHLVDKIVNQVKEYEEFEQSRIPVEPYHEHQVGVIDNLSTGRIENVKQYLNRDNFKFYCDTILNENLMDTLISNADIVFHLAANVGVDRVNQTPFLTLQDDIEGTKIVLEKAKKYWKKVLIMSSSEVYGYAESPLYEDSHRTFPAVDLRSSYAEVKITNEMLAMAYRQQYGLPVIVIRLFNTTGERQLADYGMVLPSFVKAYLENQPITIYGDGKQSRCFSYVGDVAAALWDIVKKEAYGQIFNLGSTESISINELMVAVRKIFKEYNYPLSFKYEGGADYIVKEKRQFDVDERIPNTDKIKKVLGYNPIKTPLDKIIKKMIEYEKEKK